jgi:hypothetical protein
MFPVPLSPPARGIGRVIKTGAPHRLHGDPAPVEPGSHGAARQGTLLNHRDLPPCGGSRCDDGAHWSDGSHHSGSRLIEAPWLANGGHGASLRQPVGPPPWLARRRPPAGKPKTDHDIHSLQTASSDTLCAGVRRRLWPARVRGDSQSQRPPALPLCRMAGSALAELIAGPCRTTVLISTR